jgi:tetratricopeptide (TPR) repeat protein
MRGKRLAAVLALVAGAVVARGESPPAGRLSDAALAALGAGAGAARVPVPPYKRRLKGEDAKRADAQEKRIEELCAAGKFAEAVEPAGDVADLRRRAQGQDHWQAQDAARKVQTVRQAAALPAEKRAALAEAPALNQRGEELYGRGKYAEAEPLFRKALAAYEEALGPLHPFTSTAYNNLASSLHEQGRYKEAEPLYRKALAAKERALGPSHPDTARGYDGLGTNLRAQGRPKEAEPLFRKALAIREAALGPGHPDTARAYNGLALNLDAQGRHKEAEPLFRKALAIREAALGPGHPDTARGYNNLAVNLQAQGRHKEAEPFFRKALAVYEAALSPGHPATARGYNNLAGTLQRQGRYAEAEPLFRKALAIWERALGPGHPDAACYNNLAYCVQALGRTREAEPLYRKALAAFERVLGPGHPTTAGSYNNLALNLQAQGRCAEAEPLLRKALAIREAALGPGHPATAGSYNDLALNLQAQGRHKEAEPLLRKALAAYEEALGPLHLFTSTAYNNLASSLHEQGRYMEAEPLYRKAVAANEKALGPDHPDTARSYNNLADNLLTQGRHAEAEPLVRKALAVLEKSPGPDHRDTAAGYNNLGRCLGSQGRHAEAEPLFRKALAACERALGAGHPDTASCYENLALNLRTQERYAEAEPLWGAAAAAVEAARLRLATSGLDRAASVRHRSPFWLAACLARLDRPADAWAAAEAGLARGLLDDLAAGVAFPPDPDRERRGRERAARLAELDRLLPPLVASDKLDEAGKRLREGLLQERAALDAELAREAADLSRRAVLPLDQIQGGLGADEALVFWVDFRSAAGAADPRGDHWGCVVRRAGVPAWVRLPGSGEQDSWTGGDYRLAGRLREALSRGEPDVSDLARRLAAQRLGPLAPHLAATADLPAVRRLVVVPFGRMAGVPVEVLSDRYLVSYAPSGTVLARLREKHRPLEGPTLLALGDPEFALPSDPRPPAPPEHGLYLALVLPGGNAARAGLRAGDVLLRYGQTKLTAKTDLKPPEGGDKIPVSVWRDGKPLDGVRLDPGKLGVVISDDPPPEAARQARERELLADARTRDEVRPLPGTRLEVRALAATLPEGRAELLLGSDASEQRLAGLAAAGKLKDYRLVHLATHGTIDPAQAGWSALLLARDQLPGPEEQAKLAAAGKRVPTGRLTVETIANDWQLDADLVTLSACETALGPEGGGEGLLGFSQVLLAKGARSLVLSLWKVDDTATALLMVRFYENLLGKRDGLKAPLPKAEALQEAKRWLRTLPRAEAEALAARLGNGELRASEVEARPVVRADGGKADAPYAHPRYWAAFILLGDPD